MLTANETAGRLGRKIAQITQAGGDFATAISGLSVHSRFAKSPPARCIYGLGLGVVVQGQKQVMLAEHVFNYGPGQYMLTAINMPVVSSVTQATPEVPFLGLVLLIDPRMITQLAAEMALSQPASSGACQTICTGQLDACLLDALDRLVRLLDTPQLIAQLAPLIQREIVVRLLAGSHGPLLRRLVAAGSSSHKIARAVVWLKQNFSININVDDLASRANMSASTFRQHFRAITGVSPVQFQKQLRLQEARQLMLNQRLDAGSASIRVGYESASQFSREYARLFGEPPLRDIQRMRLAT